MKRLAAKVILTAIEDYNNGKSEDYESAVEFLLSDREYGVINWLTILKMQDVLPKIRMYVLNNKKISIKEELLKEYSNEIKNCRDDSEATTRQERKA